MKKTSLNDYLSEENQSRVQQVAKELDSFIKSRALMTALELDLFIILQKKPLASHIILKKVKIKDDIGESFLDILTYFGYLVKKDELFSNSPKTESILSRYSMFKAYWRERSVLYNDLIKLTSFLRKGIEKSDILMRWYYKKQEKRNFKNDKNSREYSENMNDTSSLWAEIFLNSMDLSSYSGLLDVGGGGGNFAVAVARRYPHLKVGIFDLPSVRKMAEKNIKGAGLVKRIAFYGNDFIKKPLPKKADIVTLNRVCWDWEDYAVNKILSRIFEMLPVGGGVAIFEGMYTGDAEADEERALHALRLMLIRGKVRTVKELSAMLSDTGFTDISVIDTKVPSRKILLGTKR